MSQARHALRSDIPALAEALARAFLTDPVWRWMVPNEERWRSRAPRLFAAELVVRMRAGHSYTTDDRAGAAVWSPPGFWRDPAISMARTAPAVVPLIGVGHIGRGLAMLRDIEKAHPRNDHWYLAVLGTDPARQGQGVASSLLAPVLERCDRDGTGAYLESSNPDNVPFYERHGFAVTGRITTSGPPIDTMWRDPTAFPPVP